MAGPPRTTVYYDADCGFCVWCVAKVMAWDRRGRLSYQPIQDPASAEPLSAVPEDRRLESWHLVTPDGRVHSAGSAFAPLLRELLLGRPLAAVLDRIPVAALDRAYHAVAGRRTTAGRLLTDGARRRARARVARRGGG